MTILFQRKTIVTVNVIYYRPDYRNILQDFVWQTPDEIPEMRRVHKFLQYWRDNIDAIISEVLVSHSFDPNWRKVDILHDHQ
jgi:uncharacterized protein Usg